MNPLAAFQVLVITMAAAMFVEAVKPEQKARMAFWGMFAALAVLGVATNAIAGAWPAASAVMIWIGSSPITFLIVFLGWVAYLQKPWRRVKAGGIDLAALTSAEYNSLAEDVHKLRLSVSGLCELAEELREKIAVVDATRAAEGLGLKQAVDQLREQYTSHHSLNADNLRAQFDNIYMAMAAIGNRERLNRLAEDIDGIADDLSAPTTDPDMKFDEAAWAIWIELEEKWRDKLNRWCELAEPYKKGVSKAVLATPEHLYRAKDWKIRDSQFPSTDTSNAVHAYKSFRIILSNWKNEWGNVNWRMSQAAFSGQAASILRGEHD